MRKVVAMNLEKEYQKKCFARYSKAGILHLIWHLCKCLTAIEWPQTD